MLVQCESIIKPAIGGDFAPTDYMFAEDSAMDMREIGPSRLSETSFKECMINVRLWYSLPPMRRRPLNR